MEQKVIEKTKEYTGKELLNMYVEEFKKNFKENEDEVFKYFEELEREYEKLKPIISKWKKEKPSEQQETVRKRGYLWEENNEKWEDVQERVSRTLTSSLTVYFNGVLDEYKKDKKKYNNLVQKFSKILKLYKNMFYDIINSRLGLLNTPQLINSGITTYRKTGEIDKERRLLYTDIDKLSDYEVIELFTELYDKLDRSYQLSACNVLSIDDSMEGILEQFNKATLISKAGGGIGLNFGKLRYKNQKLSNGGYSSGSISFMEMFDSMLRTIKQGGKNRRGQGMGSHGYGNLDKYKFWEDEFTLHPDTLDFIHQKEHNNGEGVLSNFNISVQINNTKDFLDKYKHNSWIKQVFKDEIVNEKYIKQKDFLRKLSENAWKSGDPGLMFLDKINEYNPLYNINLNIESTNVCGEIPILSNFEYRIIGNCNLISIDTSKFLKLNDRDDFDDLDRPWKDNYYVDELKSMVKISYEMLDLLLDLLMFPVDDNNRGSMLLRNIGLGMTSIQGVLQMLEIPYESKEGKLISTSLMSILETEGFKQSIKKSYIFGDYLLFPDSDKTIQPNYMYKQIYNGNFDDKYLKEYLEQGIYTLDELKEIVNTLIYHRRNVFVSTIQPSGSVGILMQTRYGDTGQQIEPFFSLQYIRKYRIPNTDNEWKEMKYINNILKHKIYKYGLPTTIVDDIIEGKIKVQDIKELPEKVRGQLKTQMEIDHMEHLEYLEYSQLFCSQSISKTINMKKNVKVEDVEKVFLESIKSPIIKDVTIYRDGSLETQVLNDTSNKKKEDKKEDKKGNILFHVGNVDINVNKKTGKIVPLERPVIMESLKKTIKITNGKDLVFHIDVGFTEDNEPFEVFIRTTNSSKDYTEMMNLFGRLFSTGLRTGVDYNEILKQVRKVKNWKNEYDKILNILQDEINMLIDLGKKKGKRRKVEIENINEERKNWKLHQRGFYIDENGTPRCPVCGEPIKLEQGCQACDCGWSSCS